jgi:squalene-hopene/tetraprenyl-beta-curcumene cyclase
MTSDADMFTRIESTRQALESQLLAQRGSDGLWSGHLSSSAVSTAVAVIALEMADGVAAAARVEQGVRWLARTINADGGWGDTPTSPSNLSAVLLARAALSRRPSLPEAASALASSAAWLQKRIGGTDEATIRAGVLAHYGKDRTFAVPILVACALANPSSSRASWKGIPPLPFELAMLPSGIFKFLRLPVVSYAIPALIAVGLAQHRQAGSRKNPFHHLRELPVKRLLRILAAMQPANGGFLEAAPLTGFVVMSLVAAGEIHHPVVRNGVGFLVSGMRNDGSWPIDTNLNLWLTSLAVKALETSPALDEPMRAELVSVYQCRQHQDIHPFTRAAPGGWSWTTLPGGVPDADDTAAALNALAMLQQPFSPTVAAGLTWLLEITNRDGGIPTFCKGWGHLPFDRSAPDLSAHALMAYAAWQDRVPEPLRARLVEGIAGIKRYLRTSQDAEGAWCPLWFGDQQAPGHRSRVYGTAAVLESLAGSPEMTDLAGPAIAWLLASQNADGGWGGEAGTPSVAETTGRAISALALYPPGLAAAQRGALWLCDQAETHGGKLKASPIGLYFASLWYDEPLYPLVFALPALQTVASGQKS